jgi:hypothetical protein
MGGDMFQRGKKTTVLLIALLCASVTMMSATAAADSRWLTPGAENMAVGSGRCSDFLNGFTVGMGVASLFGCPWCAGAAIASKALEIIAC